MSPRILTSLILCTTIIASASLVRAQPAPAAAPATAPSTRPAPQHADIPAIKPGGRNGGPNPFITRHEGFVEIAKQGNVDVLFQGDSITDGWRTRGLEVWNKTYGNLKAANFGIGGDQTQHVLWRMQNGEMDGITPKVVVLMIGTNNTSSNPPAEIAHGVELIVKYIREKSPTTKVLLLAIFPRGRTMDDPRTAVINQVNPIISKLDDGKMVRYLDIGDKFLGHTAAGPTTVPAEIMPDALHPNAAGYQIWADAMQPLLMEMLK